MRERALVRKWVATRKLGHDNLEEHELGQLRLLARPGAVEGPASVDGTVRRVMQAVHAVTKDARLVLHHLRHSAASWLWLKLRAPDYPELQRYISSMPALCAELRWSQRLRVQLCGATDGPSRAYSNVVAKVLGHGVPLTSLEHYIHTADLFLAAATARTVKSLPVMVWQGLTDASRSTVYQWLQRGPHGVVAGYRARQVLSNGGQSTPVCDDGSHVNPWRKRAAALAVRFRGEGDIGFVSRALQLYNRLDDDIPAMCRIAEVAQSCSMNVATIEHWLQQARTFAPAFGIAAPDGKSGRAFQAVPAPDVNLHRATATALDDLSAKLARASLKHPSLVGEALLIAASRFNLRRYDVCFRGEHDEIEARRFLKALHAMGLLPNGVRLTVRRTSAEDTKLPHWFRSARARGLTVKRLPPPGTSEGQAKAYARWVGIQLCDAEGASAGHAWRIGLFLACTAYAPAHSARSPLDRSSNQSTTPQGDH